MCCQVYMGRRLIRLTLGQFYLGFHAHFNADNFGLAPAPRRGLGSRCHQGLLAVRASDMGLECAPGFAELIAHRTRDKAVEVGLNVVAHLGLVLVAAVAHVTAPQHPLPVGAHHPRHPLLDLLVEVGAAQHV